MEEPKFSCPEIARFELWIEDKLSKSDFKEVTARMDAIRQINSDLRLCLKESKSNEVEFLEKIKRDISSLAYGEGVDYNTTILTNDIDKRCLEIELSELK